MVKKRKSNRLPAQPLPPPRSSVSRPAATDTIKPSTIVMIFLAFLIFGGLGYVLMYPEEGQRALNALGMGTTTTKAALKKKGGNDMTLVYVLIVFFSLALLAGGMMMYKRRRNNPEDKSKSRFGIGRFNFYKSNKSENYKSNKSEKTSDPPGMFATVKQGFTDAVAGATESIKGITTAKDRRRAGRLDGMTRRLGFR